MDAILGLGQDAVRADDRRVSRSEGGSRPPDPKPQSADKPAGARAAACR